ncbi:MAG TPA: nicotinate (nicotinamide) nucleotide adenylyltransferase [Acidobacteriaceae bacterium]|nr:nicotinate (nicotinamide) nucleotide adenylyltransferase [Acidobacteriaceae bacterium]
MRRIAFFGGSFDPPHRGHLALARAAADRFALDEVLFAPVGRQPFKASDSATPFIHRYAMTALATQGDARFIPSLIDALQESVLQDTEGTPNYTVDTLRRLRDSLLASSAPFHLVAILGADSWLDIARWHRAAELLTLCDWIVGARPGFDLSRAAQAVPSEVTVARENNGDCDLLLAHSEGTTTRVWLLPDLDESISATDLRDGLRNAEADTGIAAVEEYVRKAELYTGAAQDI